MMDIDAIVKKVRCLVNEAESDADVTLLTSDLRHIDDNIKALLPQAVAMVQKLKTPECGPVNVKSFSPVPVAVTDNGDGGGSLLLPDGFVGLVAAQLDGWERPATVAFPGGSPEAVRQKSAYTRAGLCKPVCVLDVNSGGQRVLLFYPLVGSQGTLKSFVYEAALDLVEGGLACCASMADAVAYECAALLYNMFERYDAANSFFSLASALCNGKNNERR